ncbi:hypothetical protein GWI33_007651 [Rhynchophorus ferrugineus]|uniref:Uncharacterized protein n=1 Tax=Rhynchophorus ferrugineus TaxID=354439 RepID=A0A834IDY8_RHYFE|nr:hypothetical protein GWI33_007651 [Rhynchophorus ferrugineus]
MIFRLISCRPEKRQLFQPRWHENHKNNRKTKKIGPDTSLCVVFVTRTMLLGGHLTSRHPPRVDLDIGPVHIRFISIFERLGPGMRSSLFRVSIDFPLRYISDYKRYSALIHASIIQQNHGEDRKIVFVQYIYI